MYYYQLDHLGTPQEMTDTTGNTVWSVQYRAYGNVLKQEVEEIHSPLRFQGQYYDVETGLHYNRHRYYNPNSAAFLTLDPIGLAGGLNNYQYVPNPTGWIDPLGLANKKGDEFCCGGDGPNANRVHNGSESSIQYAQLKEHYRALDSKYTPLANKRIVGNNHPINFEKANTVHSVRDGANVRYNPDAYPDFIPVSVINVDIPKMVGKRRTDFKAANIEAGFGTGAYSHQEFFPNHIWHHHQNGRTMMLVPEDYHAVGHSGGDSIAKKVGGLNEKLKSN
nr:RHS repeat-associated core domain-containing protein [Motilimonas pumila]